MRNYAVLAYCGLHEMRPVSVYATFVRCAAETVIELLGKLIVIDSPSALTDTRPVRFSRPLYAT